MPNRLGCTPGSPRVGGARLADWTPVDNDLESLYGPASVADLVREALEQLHGSDGDLLGGLVHPGDLVVLKPNLLRHDSQHSPEWRHVITHPSLIQAVLDLVGPRLAGKGKIVVTDGPQTDSSFDRICQQTGLQRIAAEAQARHGVPISLIDLREEEWTTRDGVVLSRRTLQGDPLGYCDIDLGRASAFESHPGEGHYYGASFDTAETNWKHAGSHHRYRLSRTVMDADLLINLPKLKTHKKAGITASLKNLVGANGNKNWLPHYTLQTTDHAGDQYPPSARRGMEAVLIQRGKLFLSRFPRLARFLVPLKATGRLVFGDTSQVIRSGNWFGNDTLWRMVLDLNRAILWHYSSGECRETPRRYLTLADGIVAGDGSGPESPDPHPLGWILAGTDPVAVDIVAARLMGFEWRAIPIVCRAYDRSRFPLTHTTDQQVRFKHRNGAYSVECIPRCDISSCRPHFGWDGRLQVSSTATPVSPLDIRHVS